MFLVLFRELGTSANRLTTEPHRKWWLHLLFSRSSSSRVLVHHRRVDHLTLVDTPLHPKIRFYIFVRFALVCLDQVLEDLRVWIREYDARRLGARRGIPPRMLQSTRSAPFHAGVHQTPSPFPRPPLVIRSSLPSAHGHIHIHTHGRDETMHSP